MFGYNNLGAAKKYADKITTFDIVDAIINGGFESDFTGWTGSGEETTIDIVTFKEGAKAVKFSLVNKAKTIYQNLSFPDGHKIYVVAYSLLESAEDVASATVTDRWGVSDYNTAATNVVRASFLGGLGEWAKSSLIKTAASGGIRVTLGRAVAATAVYYFDCVVAVDLTEMFEEFGISSDPTVEVFERFISAITDGDNIKKTVFNLNNAAYWQGKRANIIGDSITSANATTTNFSKVAADMLGMTINNYGVGGSMIAVQESSPTTRDPMVTRYTSMANDVDLVIVAGGTNDWQYGLCPLGAFTDRTSYTYYGALHNLCLGLLNKYPGKQLLFMTPVKRKQDPLLTQESTNANEKTLAEYCDIIKEVCGYYGIPVLDMNKECTLNPHIESQQIYYNVEDDGDTITHPNAAGHAIMSRKLVGYLRQLG